METFTLLVGGQDVDTGRYAYFPYADKAIAERQETRRIIRELEAGRYPLGWEKYVFARYCIGKEDTNPQALESAYRAGSLFKQFSLASRRKIYDDIHRLLLANKEEFLKLLIIEGHPRRLAEWEFEGMEVGSRPETIEFYKNQLRKEVGRSENEVLYWVRKPDGVVCLSPPGNASASNSFTAILVFLSGNTLVIKPPLKAPLATIFLWKKVVQEALKRNGAPPGTLNIIVGNSETVTEEWLTSPYVNDIAFFGDSKTGLPLAARAFQHGKKAILELSGNDMLLVWKDGDLNKAASSILDGFLGSGQICMVPKIALIHQDVYDVFLEKVVEGAKNLKIGLASDPETILSPVTRIHEYMEFVEDAKRHGRGAEILCGGERVDHLNQPDTNGFYIRPTVLAVRDDEAATSLKCLREEIFFPLLPIVRICGDDQSIFQKMVKIANNNEYGLRISVWVTSNFYTRRFAKNLDNCGLLRINLRHVGFSAYLATHGGTGRTGGPFGEMNYMWQKTSHLQGVCRGLIKRSLIKSESELLTVQ